MPRGATDAPTPAFNGGSEHGVLFEARFAQGSGFKGGNVNGGDLGERLGGRVGAALGCQYGF